MLDLLKDCYLCFLLSLVKKYLNSHIIYHSLSFFIEKSFLHSLVYILFLFTLSFLFLSTFSVFLKSLNNYFYISFASSFNKIVLCELPIFFMLPAVSHIFHVAVFSGSRFFRVPGFSGSRFFCVQIF